MFVCFMYLILVICVLCYGLQLLFCFVHGVVSRSLSTDGSRCPLSPIFGIFVFYVCVSK